MYSSNCFRILNIFTIYFYFLQHFPNNILEKHKIRKHLDFSAQSIPIMSFVIVLESAIE